MLQGSAAMAHDRPSSVPMRMWARDRGIENDESQVKRDRDFYYAGAAAAVAAAAVCDARAAQAAAIAAATAANTDAESASAATGAGRMGDCAPNAVQAAQLPAAVTPGNNHQPDTGRATVRGKGRIFAFPKWPKLGGNPRKKASGEKIGCNVVTDQDDTDVPVLNAATAKKEGDAQVAAMARLSGERDEGGGAKTAADARVGDVGGTETSREGSTAGSCRSEKAFPASMRHDLDMGEAFPMKSKGEDDGARAEEEVEEVVEKQGLFKADAVNEEDPERDRATREGQACAMGEKRDRWMAEVQRSQFVLVYRIVGRHASC